MPVPPHRLQERVDVLLRGRALMRAPARAFVLDHYRRHRRLPPAYVTALLSKAAIRRLWLRGELEHVLGLARFFARLDRLTKPRKARTLF
jgi:hypothetical protein